LTEDEVLMG